VNVTTITMPKQEALAKLEAYQRQLRRRSDKEYEEAAAGYAALAAGTPLLNLADAFAQAGLGEDGRPRLAVAMADRKQVYVRVNQNDLEFSTLGRSRRNYSGTLLITVPFPGAAGRRWQDGYSLVPMVPADVRPETGPLSDYLILWEVEKWVDRPIRATPDCDPFLLKHLGGDLYAIIAQWDLTPLEQAIMTGRREG
jgi:hypothetical protein